MTHWNSWFEKHSMLCQFASAEPFSNGAFRYPNLRDTSDLVVASDYSGDYAKSEFQVFSFLVTNKRSILDNWDGTRLDIRKRYLRKSGDDRRMSFKGLSDGLKIEALPHFLDAASRLHGLLVCIAVDKSFILPRPPNWSPVHDWVLESLQNALRACFFGSVLINGLRGKLQRVHWISDDDAVLANQNAISDTGSLMYSQLKAFGGEPRVDLGLGIASQFKDDEMRAEDLVAIPDLAAGAIAETHTQYGKALMPMVSTGPVGIALKLQLKSALINCWRSEKNHALKHLTVTIRTPRQTGAHVFGKCIVSLGEPFSRLPFPHEQVSAMPLNPKWKRSLENYLTRKGTTSSPVEV